MLLLFLFMKQSSNSTDSVPVPVVASVVSLALPLPQGPAGTGVHVLNPPPLQFLGTVWVWALQGPCPPVKAAGVLGLGWRAHDPVGQVPKAVLWAQPLGLAMAPGPSMGEGGLGAQAAQKGHPVWHEGNVPCAWWTSSTEWVPQSSCDRRLRLIEKPSFPTQTPLDSDSLSGEDNKRRRGCREPQQCMSVLAEPGCASVVLWGVAEALAMRREGYTFGVSPPFSFWHLWVALGSCPCLSALGRQLITAERSVQPLLCWVV